MSYFKTKNEVEEMDGTEPDIQEVGADEILQRIGEIFNIVGKSIIIKALPPSASPWSPSQTLDSETLVVFDDRKVVGYVSFLFMPSHSVCFILLVRIGNQIYDTFGPTSEPMYQVKIHPSSSLTETELYISRPIFHIPARSRFVFINHDKGSDASNQNDEEPAEDELDFSDDETELKHRKKVNNRQVSS
jgi:H/ACA ribonucleoprotein complex non-core subunit NAF1